MTHKLSILLMALTCCTGCMINAGNGMFVYDSKESHLGFSHQSTTNDDGTKETTTHLGTKGMPKGGGDVLTVRDLMIERLRKGESITTIAKALGVDPELLREWIK